MSCRRSPSRSRNIFVPCSALDRRRRGKGRRSFTFAPRIFVQVSTKSIGAASDSRRLSKWHSMPEFRRDPVIGRWVIIAAERAQRPQARNLHGNSTDTGPCPFCAGNEGMTPPEVLVRRADQTDSGKGGWTVRVVPNKYPALVNDSDLLMHEDELYEWMNGLGVHEVIIESPEHLENMAMLSERQLEAVLSAYRDRMLDLRADHRWKYILVYKNQGVEAGATFPHAHSQLVALPIMPKAALEEIDAAKRF